MGVGGYDGDGGDRGEEEVRGVNGVSRGDGERRVGKGGEKGSTVEALWMKRKCRVL